MSTTRSFRLDPEVDERLTKLAEATDRPRAWHIQRAVDAYLELHAWQEKHIREGIAAADRGETVSHDEAVSQIRRHLKGLRRRYSKRRA